MNHRARRVCPALAAGVLALSMTATIDARDHQDEPVLRGEAARLLRQAYDYRYRNSNRNVFRSSRHAHPTDNVFRSSKHYQRRLAASYDGYPLRTFVRLPGRGDGDDRSFSFAHHRRRPYGAGAAEEQYGFGYGASRYGGHGRYGVPYFAHVPPPQDRIDERVRETPPAPRPPRYRPRSRDEIEMVEIHVHRPEPTQRAQLRTITLPDGRVRTAIVSEPIASSIDDAWRQLGAGEHDAARTLFATHATDLSRGVEAMLGHGLAAAAAGDDETAAVMVRRALAIDPAVIDGLEPDAAVVAAIRAVHERLSADDADPGEALAELRGVCARLAGSAIDDGR